MRSRTKSAGTAGSSARIDHCSSKLATCPRSQTTGLSSGLTWRTRSASSSGSISSSVRARAVARCVQGERAPAALAQEQEREGLGRIREGAHGLEAVARDGGRHLVGTELPADLGHDHLAGRDAEAPAEVAKLDHRLAREAREDLDPVEPVV